MTDQIEAERARLTRLVRDAERALRFIEALANPREINMNVILTAEGPRRPLMSGLGASLSPSAARRMLEALRDAARDELALLGDGDAPT